MTDLALKWIAGVGADLAMNGPDLAVDDGMETAVIISLFTDRRARPDDDIPDGTGDRRGWWADQFADIEGDQIGSRLWLLSRSKHQPAVLVRAKEYAEEALAWMVRDRIAASVSITADWVGENGFGIVVEIKKPNGADARFDYVWNLI